MKGICINNYEVSGELKINEVYEINETEHPDYYRTEFNDSEYFRYRFKLISEVRDEKIDKILGI